MSIRNVAIIAHVDHGKTTLVDAMLKQTGVFRAGQDVGERIMDSNELERERGITILAKNTAIAWQGHKINIVDTPGHADFGGEVERILSMVDGALLVVDAAEGPMPQTRFVVQKALAQGLVPILVVNKVDRPDARSRAVVDEVLELFIDLGAGADQIDFPIYYASARFGFAVDDVAVAERAAGAGAAGARGAGDGETPATIHPLLDAIVRHVPPPSGDPLAPLQVLVTSLDWDDYIGRIAIGRVRNGRIRDGQQVAVVRGGTDGPPRLLKVVKLFTYGSLRRLEAAEAPAGDVVAAALSGEIEIGDTIADPETPLSLPPVAVDEPTLTMTFRVNDSPFAGREGRYVTSRHLRDRLAREKRTNVALRVTETDSPDAFTVAGRGELHLAILMETMRREGYELAVTKPEVILRHTAGGVLEPIERLVIDVPEEFVGVAMEGLGRRRAELAHMVHGQQGRVRLEFTVPARGLVGFRSQFLTETKGTGIMHHNFAGYGPYRGDIPGRSRGVVVAWEAGEATAYALNQIQERAMLFITPGTPVYEGMVVGENSREEDMDVNVCKKKHLSNVRSAGGDEALRLTVPRIMSLEQCLEFVGPDELVEITPHGIRLRKQVLGRHERHRLAGERARAGR